MSGSIRDPGGRMADTSSGLSESLRNLGFRGRTVQDGHALPDQRSVDRFHRVRKAAGRRAAAAFSFLPLPELLSPMIFSLLIEGVFHMEQLPCWITHTTAQTHDIIRQNLDDRHSIPEESKGPDRVIAPPSKIRSSSSPTRRRIKFSSSRKEGIRRSSMSTDSRPACRTTFKSSSSDPSLVWNGPSSCGRVTRSNTTISRRPNYSRRWKPSWSKASISPVRSTALQDMKRLLHKDL